MAGVLPDANVDGVARHTISLVVFVTGARVRGGACLGALGELGARGGVLEQLSISVHVPLVPAPGPGEKREGRKEGRERHSHKSGAK